MRWIDLRRSIERFSHRRDMLRRGAAASADNARTGFAETKAHNRRSNPDQPDT